MVANFPNVVMTRTFSKVYALAGLRIGWAYCPAAGRRRAQSHPRPVQRLGSRPAGRRARRSPIAIMSRRSVEHNERWRAWLTDAIRADRPRVDDSVANFILIHFPRSQGKTAEDADRFLCERGLILRARRQLRLARLPEADRRSRRRQPQGRRGPCRIHEAAMSDDFRKVALLGIGLIGSSMAHAMRRGGLAAHIAGYFASRGNAGARARGGFCGFAARRRRRPA